MPWLTFDVWAKAKLMKQLLSITVLLVVVGCSSVAPPAVRPLSVSVDEINLPKLGEVTTAELGQTLLERAKIHFYTILDLKAPVAVTSNNHTFSIEPQSLRGTSEDDRWTYYRAATVGWHSIFNIGIARTLSGHDFGLRVSKHEKLCEFYWHDHKPPYLQIASPPVFEEHRTTALDRPNFRQELIYNGRIKDSLKFLYRELSSDIMRPAFTQDIQYDISSSSLVGFKGARLEILDATNESIRYRVIEPFPDISSKGFR